MALLFVRYNIPVIDPFARFVVQSVGKFVKVNCALLSVDSMPFCKLETIIMHAVGPYCYHK